MPDPTVSLIMAAYSPRRDWIRKAVSSALDQRDCSFELIVVDDGSPEPVVGLLDGLTGERLRPLRVPHGGPSHARNAGIAASRGAYLRFLDADDVFPPYSTAQMLDLAGGSQSIIACGATRFCDEVLEPMFDWIASCPADAVHSFLLQRSMPMLPSLLFPRSVIERTGPWHVSKLPALDWDFILRALEHGRVVETRQALTWYRQHPRSTSRDPEGAWRAILLGIDRYFERHPDERRGPLARQVPSMLDLFAAELSTPGAPWRDRRFWRALVRDPTCVGMIRHRYVHPRAQAARMRLRRRFVGRTQPHGRLQSSS